MKRTAWKKMVLAAVLCGGAPLSAAFPASVYTQNAITDKFLDMGGTWEPFLVSIADGKAVLLMDEATVPLDFVLVALPVGVCSLTQEHDDHLSSVTEIAILNRRGDQGYVFEGGREACARIYSSGSEASDSLVRARLRPHSL